MNDSERRRLTFKEREGLIPLPRQLQKHELTPALTARMFNLIYTVVKSEADFVSIGPVWGAILKSYWVNELNEPVDDYDSSLLKNIAFIKGELIQSSYGDFYGFLEHVVQHSRAPAQLWRLIEKILREEQAAFTIIDKTFVPVNSDADVVSLTDAAEAVHNLGPEGAQKHIRNAIHELNAGQYAGSVRESIHAVEATARVLADRDGLKKALQNLQSRIDLDANLIRAFEKLYDYSSDRPGMRHPLLEKGDANVDEADAMFMLGSCSAFVSYLLKKANSSGLLT